MYILVMPLALALVLPVSGTLAQLLFGPFNHEVSTVAPVISSIGCFKFRFPVSYSRVFLKHLPDRIRWNNMEATLQACKDGIINRTTADKVFFGFSVFGCSYGNDNPGLVSKLAASTNCVKGVGRMGGIQLYQIVRPVSGVLGKRQYCMGNRDETFAPFIFDLKSGGYRIRLTHANGSLTCNPTVDRRPSKWGCDHPAYGPASVKLTIITDDHRKVIVPRAAFDEDDGRLAHSSYIATSSCTRFHSGKKYRVYQQEDMLNKWESNNSGRVCFTITADSSTCSA